MQYTRTAVEFVEIPANENQNLFVRTIVAVPTMHLSPFSLLGCGAFLLRRELQVVVAQPRLPDCQSQSDENIRPRSLLVDGRPPRRQCLH